MNVRILISKVKVVVVFVALASVISQQSHGMQPDVQGPLARTEIKLPYKPSMLIPLALFAPETARVKSIGLTAPYGVWIDDLTSAHNSVYKDPFGILYVPQRGFNCNDTFYIHWADGARTQVDLIISPSHLEEKKK